MSRIGRMPIKVPAKVSVEFKDNTMIVKGPLGELKEKYNEVIEFSVNEDTITVSRKDDERQSRAFHGLYRKLLSNMVEGVSKGFTKTLLINGVGYRAELKGESILLNLGYSTQFEYLLPKEVKAKLETPVKIVLSSFNKVILGQTAAEIRSLRKIEPYKLKGIKYEGEILKQKAGKSSAK